MKAEAIRSWAIEPKNPLAHGAVPRKLSSCTGCLRRKGAQVLRRLADDDIFISYARADAATYADGLASALVLRGFSVFVDRLGIHADSRIPPSMLDKLRAASMPRPALPGSGHRCSQPRYARRRSERSLLLAARPG